MITFYEDFAGVGGFRLALERLRWRCVGSCELDKYARQTYKANFGEEPTFKDTTKVEVLPFSYDVYTAGFPCQDFSIAGQRKGIDGARGSLVYHVLRRIETDRPKAFIFENVKGLLSVDDGKTFRWITKQLYQMGYRVYHKVLNSKDFGVPQNRERVFIVGFRNDIHNPMADGVFIYPKGYGYPPLSSVLEGVVDKKYYLSGKMVNALEKHLKKHREAGNGFGMNIIDAYNKSYNRNQNQSKAIRTNEGCSTAGQIVANTISQRYGKDGSDNLIFDCKGFDSRTKGFRESEGTTPALTQKMGTGGNTVPMVISAHPRCGNSKKGGIGLLTSKKHSFTIDSKSHIIEDFYSNRENREYGEVAPTLRKDRQGLKVANAVDCDGYLRKGKRKRVNGKPVLTSVHERRLRRLTPMECFRLQGFPDEFVLKAQKIGVSDTQLYRQAGNAITVNVVEVIGKQMELILK